MNIKKIFTTMLLMGVINSISCSQKPQIRPPTIVETANPIQKVWQRTVQENGSLSAFKGTQVSPEIAGRIIKIFFKSGQYIHEGTPLILIYPDILKAELQKAQANLKLSELDYARYLQVYKKGYYSKADLDKAYNTLKSNQATVDQLKAELIQTVVMAPFTGELGLRQVSIGDYIQPGDSIASLQSIDPLRVDFSIPEKYLPHLEIGDRIDVNLPSATHPYSGQIFAFDSMINSQTRMLNVRGKIPNPTHELLPGAYADVKVYLDKPQNIVVIPQTAISYTTEEAYVYRMIDNKAVKTPIKLGERLNNNEVIVTEGLKTSDVVITAGQMKLEDGSPVMTQPAMQKTSGSQTTSPTKTPETKKDK